MNALTEKANNVIWHMRNRMIADEYDMILCVLKAAQDKIMTVEDAQSSILNIINASQGDDLFLNVLTQEYFMCVSDYQRLV